MNTKKKAVALISGGLDSILAIRIIMEQGIECIGVYFTSPFWSNKEKEEKLIKKIALTNKFELLIIPVDNEYIEIIKNPKHGWGKTLNPCIDCKIYMFKKAKEIMGKNEASFIISGEVLGQRPMSQQRNTLNLIEKEACLKGMIVRPLSAKIMKSTEAEEKGIINRDKLFEISGRSRKIQFELGKKFDINDFTSPAGGCLLTDKLFAKKLRDIFENNNNYTFNDIELLKYGRHFRYNGNKIIVGRNEKENEKLVKMKDKDDYFFEVLDYGSPNTILQSKRDQDSIIFASKLTAFYSDCIDEEITVKFGDKELTHSIVVPKITREEVDKYNIVNL